MTKSPIIFCLFLVISSNVPEWLAGWLAGAINSDVLPGEEAFAGDDVRYSTFLFPVRRPVLTAHSQLFGVRVP